MMDDIAPLWLNLRNYVRHPEKAVSWPLAFSVHAMLTAILETDSITDSLMTTSDTTFHNFFHQVEWANSLLHDDSSIQYKTFQNNLYAVLFLENLGLPSFGRRAIWNPLFAGTSFSYLTYFGNMEAGCSMVDHHAQLRIVMFLYHGLILNRIIESGSIPFLDVLYTSFKKSRAVWGGELPCRGELVQRFWTCFGLDRVNTRKMIDEARRRHESTSSMGRRAADAGQFLRRSRNMKSIEPEEISKSYRRICNNDFHDVVDKYHTTEQREGRTNSANFAMAVRINDTIDAIGEEQQLLSFNLISCGVILERFVCGLIQVMKWDPLMTAFIRGNPSERLDRRQGAVQLFAQFLLAALDFSSDPMDHELLGVKLGRTSSSYLKEYFASVSRDKVLWFVPVDLEVDE
jgi:hypothetical protein